MEETVKLTALRLLSKLQPCTSAELKEAHDWPERQPANVLNVLRREGLAELIDGENYLTDDGTRAALNEPVLTRPAPPIDVDNLTKARQLTKRAEAVRGSLQENVRVTATDSKTGEVLLDNTAIKVTPNELENGLRKTGKPENRKTGKSRQYANDYDLLDRMIETFVSAADDLKRIRNRLKTLDLTTGQG